MYSYNKRSAYSNNEIASFFKKKMEENKHSIKDIVKIYKPKYSEIDNKTVEYMISGTVFYDLTMLEIASEYLEIPFNDLTNIIEDDIHISYRKSDDPDQKDFVDLVNYLFSEMIRQDKLNR